MSVSDGRRRYIAVATFLVLDLVLAGAVFSWLSATSPRSPQAPGAASTRSPGWTVQQQLFLPLAVMEPHRRGAAVATPPVIMPPSSPNAGESAWEARIEIVWPHGNAALRDAQLANITAYLIAGPGNTPPPCDAQPVVRLWRALNVEPARPVAVGRKRMFTSGGETFPVWDFDDVDVSAARNPANRVLFFATVDGVATRHNVWVHAVDARTVFPQAESPAAVVAEPPAAVDARIEILWPHGDPSPERAGLANASVYLFDTARGRALAPAIAWAPAVRLHWAANDEPDQGERSSRLGTRRVVAGDNGLQFLAWDFNDLDISQTHHPLNKLHFWVSVDEVPTFSNVWTHGAAAPTIHPRTVVMTSCR